jgi:hypothetical protein
MTAQWDYNTLRRDMLAGASRIGQGLQSREAAERAGLNTEQRKRIRAKNFMTDDVWQYRKLAGGSLVVEIAFGHMLGNPLIGLTVFCVKELAGDAAQWDHSLSGVFNDVPSALGRLASLNAGGRERIAALAVKES